jgi:DNA repair exonuclease SbcCD ATPase subunit
LREDEHLNLEEIENIKEKIAEAKFKEIQIQKSQQEVEDSLLRAIKLNHLEEIARKKVELQRIADQRKELEKKELQNSAHLEALIEEQQRRDDQSLENLKKILHKAEHLEKALKNGDLDRENQILLAHALEEGGDHAEKQRKRMIDEIIAKKQREKQEKVLQLEDNIRNLNEKRWELVQNHENLLKHRQVHQSLQARGLDFLSEMEMGKIPNIEYIKKNLEELPVDMTDNDEDANHVVERVSADLGEMEARVNYLRGEKEKILRKIAYSNRPYLGEEDIRKIQPDVNLSTYTSMKDLVYDLVDDVWGAILILDKNVEYIMRKKDYYLRKSRALKEKALFYSEQMVLRLVSLNLVEEVLEEICNEVAEECNSFIHFSETLIMNFVAAAYIDQRGSKMTPKSLVESLKTMLKDTYNNN